jgi:hypothetical protein
MSRSLLISFFVIFFVFSIQVVNTVNADYMSEKQRPLFPFTVDDGRFSGLTDKLNRFDDAGTNATFNEMVTPTEQSEKSGSGITEFWDTARKSLSLLNILLYTIFYATIGFGAFLNNIGNGIVIIPPIITIPLTIGVNLLHIINVMSYIRGVNFED